VVASMVVWLVVLCNQAESETVGVYDYEPSLDEALALAAEFLGEARVTELTQPKLHGHVSIEEWPIEKRFDG